jgi:hypothetical protein
MSAFLDALKKIKEEDFYDPPIYNLVPELIAFFSTEDKPMYLDEFAAFWKSLTEGEKEYYRHAKL